MSTVFFDIDTQLDFVNPSGSLYVPGSEKILPVVARLNRYALNAGHSLISTTDCHTENDPEFQQWPPHCVVGTLGQRKPSSTIVGNLVRVPSSPGQYKYQEGDQIILETQELDCFSNPNLKPLLESLQPERIVVYGVVTEYCVQCAAMGALKMARRVELVMDAIQSLDSDASRHFIDEFVATGGLLTSCDEACG